MTLLTGSDRQPLADAISIGAAHPDERLEITLVMRPGNLTGLQALLGQIIDGSAHPLNRNEYAAKHATLDADVQKVVEFAKTNDLVVVSVDTHTHRVILSATVERANAAFGVELHSYAYTGGTYRGRVGAIHLPPALDGVVDAVLGLDNRPIATPHFRPVTQRGNVRWAARNVSYYPTAVAELYDFPAGGGHGQCIALVELGGGYRNADLTTYFLNDLHLTSVPTVRTISIDHAANAPTGNANGPDGEVMLDIEVAAAIAPDAVIAVYFTNNTDAGFLNAITAAMHDTVNRPTVISISWGGPENAWTPQAMHAYDAAFQQAAVLGITVCVASGDNGSSDGETDGLDHVDFPASSPHVLACGGSYLRTGATGIQNETVWNDGSGGGASGGGISTVFYAFDWQKNITVDGHPLAKRGVPDVCGDADPASGYRILVDGQLTVIGGTSAVAPLWAALIARINANRGHSIGWVHSTLYANPSVFRDITVGTNGSFDACAGWDAATGLGSPKGTAIAAAFNTEVMDLRN